MSSQMTDTDGATLPPEYAAEGFRLVIPLMGKHGVPPTPDNYAVWYQYVTGENPALKAEMDARIAEGKPFDEQCNGSLFQRHIQGISLTNSQASGRISDILANLLSDLSQLSQETGNYDARLQAHLDRAKHCNSMQDLEALLEVLADETTQMRQATRALREDFELRSLEMQELQNELRQVKRAAISDPLTGLPNRRALLDAMGELYADPQAPHHSLLMLDIDNFKGINDRHGHLIGDRVIRFVADVIRQNIKGQDTPARFGGEEYAILLPNTQLAGAATVAENIRHAIASARLVRSANQEPLGIITVSCGVATFRKGEDSLELIERADQALYLAKERGRNKVVPETEL
jgi:diguanylate cyclase